jgi:hypothetical protein
VAHSTGSRSKCKRPSTSSCRKALTPNRSHQRRHRTLHRADKSRTCRQAFPVQVPGFNPALGSFRPYCGPPFCPEGCQPIAPSPANRPVLNRSFKDLDTALIADCMESPARRGHCQNSAGTPDSLQPHGRRLQRSKTDPSTLRALRPSREESAAPSFIGPWRATSTDREFLGRVVLFPRVSPSRCEYLAPHPEDTHEPNRRLS